MKKPVKLGKRIILCVTGVLGTLILAFIAMNLYVLLSTPKEYMITAENTIEYQSGYECSGYAAAYVLRSMGEEADGLTLYQNNPYKNTDGTVSPENLVRYLQESGCKAKLCSGTIMQMKHALSRGVPVIAFVKTSPQESYYHYLPIVGYDEENIYAADSLRAYVNADEQHYNRILSESDLEAMLETEICKKNTYIVLKQ